MKKFFSGLAALFFSTLAFAGGFDECRMLFPGDSPPVVKGERLREICFSDFAVLHSGVTRTPVYAVERMNRVSLLDASDERRTDRFYPEARLPARDRADLESYRGSGFDRGHMAPAADRATADAMAQSFSLANMVPQAPVNNRKVWAKIEKDTRKYVMRAAGDVFVFTGPLFLEERGYVGNVKVPSHLFKLVYDATTKRSWVHLVENSDEARIGQPVSYSELVRISGIQFLGS